MFPKVMRELPLLPEFEDSHWSVSTQHLLSLFSCVVHVEWIPLWLICASVSSRTARLVGLRGYIDPVMLAPSRRLSVYVLTHAVHARQMEMLDVPKQTLKCSTPRFGIRYPPTLAPFYVTSIC